MTKVRGKTKVCELFSNELLLAGSLAAVSKGQKLLFTSFSKLSRKLFRGFQWKFSKAFAEF